MDRQIVYPGAIPFDTDMLSAQRNSLVGLGWALHSILGTGTLVDGLSCAPTTPASMEIQVGPGAIYSLENLDATAYGSLAADTTHQIVKQGIAPDSQTFTLTAPTTAGTSQVYLVEAAYQDQDIDAVVLPYYNAANPTQAFAGPNNSGTAQNTVRNGLCAIQVKAGVAATTGSETAPAVDTGWTALYTVTVAQGQTTIVAGNIAQVSGAPFVTEGLTEKVGGAGAGTSGHIAEWTGSSDIGDGGVLGALANLNIGAGLINDGAGNAAVGRVAQPTFAPVSAKAGYTLAPSTTYTQTVSFTPPANGWAIVLGFVNLTQELASSSSVELVLNGGQIAGDTTPLPMSLSAIVSVSAGEACTASIQYTAGPTLSGGSNSQAVTVFFIPEQ